MHPGKRILAISLMVELGMDHLGPLLFFWRYAGVTIMAMRSCSSSGEEGLAMLAAMMEVHGSTLQPPISLRTKGGVALFSGMEFSTMFLPADFGITRQ